MSTTFCCAKQLDTLVSTIRLFLEDSYGSFGNMGISRDIRSLCGSSGKFGSWLLSWLGYEQGEGTVE